jgi:lipopolysaccharide transport system ATP-binding protein
VVVEGDIACLFELATGFEMEATGWDNILTRGLLLGLSRAEIRDRMRDIAEFTELGAALDRPLKTYSAGMFVRLAFAVSTAISPDVLLLDEVIAAGDVRFHEKARRRLEEMVQRASILVLVSHSMETVRQMCRRAIWLSEGTVRLDGPADEVTAAYERGAAEMAGISSGSSA